MTWSEFPPPTGPTTTALQPVIVAVGGFLVTFTTGLLDDLTTISVADSSLGPATTWTTITLPVSSPPLPFRNGGRIVLFGSVLYRFGGTDQSGSHNDLWALDLSYAIATGFLNGISSVGWVQVLPDQATPNYPPPRNSHVFCTEGHTLIIFGGASGPNYLNDVSGGAGARSGGGDHARARVIYM